MKDTNIIHAIGGIDDELIERAEPNGTAARTRFTPWLRWAVPVAACLVVAATIAVPSLFNSAAPDEPESVAGMGGEQLETPSGNDEACYPARLDVIFGLPSDDYTWDEGDGVMADRMLTSELRHLMYAFDKTGDKAPSETKAAFAVVKAERVERFSEDGREGQITMCGVLYDVLGDGMEEPLKVKQYLYGGCVGDEQTNLLRVGGVYVLSLVTWPGEDVWHIYGDLDVLFEVDDKGLIHSHSAFEQFKKYDGVKLEELWKDIVFLYDNPLLRSRFADYISQGYLVENEAQTIALVHPDAGWNEADAEGFSAKIGADGRITIATDGFNVFRPVEGLTMEEMNQAIHEIRRFTGLEDDSPAEPEPTATPVDGSEYAAIVREYGAFMRLESLPDGGFAAISGALPLE